MSKNFISLVLVSLSILAFGSCKPKQSAYRSVYEAAKEREVDNDYTEEETSTISRPATPIHSSNESVKKEKVKPVYESDASGLRTYSVVIAAMGMKPNAESLKKRMEDAGYKIILVQNEQGMYRVIIASYDSKDQAVARRNEILDAFRDQGDKDTLRNKYGIPFDDWWILQREF